MKKKFTPGYLLLALCVASLLSCSSNDKKPDEAASPDAVEATSDASAPSPDGTAAPADGNAPAAASNGTVAPPADGSCSATDQDAKCGSPTSRRFGAKGPRNFARGRYVCSGSCSRRCSSSRCEWCCSPRRSKRSSASRSANAAPADPTCCPSHGCCCSCGLTPTTLAQNPSSTDQSQTDLFGAATSGRFI